MNHFWEALYFLLYKNSLTSESTVFNRAILYPLFPFFHEKKVQGGANLRVSWVMPTFS